MRRGFASRMCLECQGLCCEEDGVLSGMIWSRRGMLIVRRGLILKRIESGVDKCGRVGKIFQLYFGYWESLEL